MGVFRPVVEVAVLPMLDTGQEFPLRWAIAFGFPVVIGKFLALRYDALRYKEL
jgi:hypothetical protein